MVFAGQETLAIGSLDDVNYSAGQHHNDRC